MSDLVRLSFSLEPTLLTRLERMVKERRYENRSEFIRDLIRSRLVEQEWERNQEALGTVTIIYNHQFRRLANDITGLQHRHHGAVLATTHIHLDEQICAEMIMIKGRAAEIRKIADNLSRQKGVLHSALSMSSTGKKLV